MATAEEKQETIDVLKGPRFYRLTINGYGGEGAYINISKEAYDFWQPLVEEHGDSDLVEYMLNAEFEDFEFENIEEVPAEADFMWDKDYECHRQWYEHHDEFIHQNGVEYSSAYLTVEEVDSAEYMSKFVAEVIDRENLQEYLDGVMEANDYEFDLVECDEDLDGVGDYVVQMYR